MDKMTTRTIKKISPSRTIEDIFEDNYEYETYFEIVSDIKLGRNCPNTLEVQFNLKIKTIRLRYPEKDPSVVIVEVPISKTVNNSPRKKALLRAKYLKLFKSTVPEIRLELKDQIAIRKRTLINAKEKIIGGTKISHITRNLITQYKLQPIPINALVPMAI